MANITIFSVSNLNFSTPHCYDTFVQAIANGFARNGNNVLNIDLGPFITKYACNPEIRQGKKILDIVKKFKTDFIVTFNNILPDLEGIRKLNCPIILYPSDGIDFFNNIDFLKKNIEKYFFFKVTDSHLESYKNYNLYIKQNRFIELGYITDFEPIDINQDINISFLGSIQNYDYTLINHLIHKKDDTLLRIINDNIDILKSNPTRKLNINLECFSGNSELSENTALLWMLTSNLRFDILSELLDQGIRIYGLPTFLYCAMYNTKFLNSYSFQDLRLKREVETLYNRSKVSLNLPNARNTTGLSWRVSDILATNSVLLSNKSKDLDCLTKGYIELPTYNSKLEAKEILKKLLSDNTYRKEIVYACNKIVNDKCRFEHYMSNIETAIKIKLTNQNPGHIKELYFINNPFLNLRKLLKKFIKKSLPNKVINFLPYCIAKRCLD